CSFTAPALPSIFTLSLHDALPISSAFLPEFVHMIAWNRSDMRQFGLRAKIIQRNRRQIVFQIHSAEHPRIDTVSAGKVNFLAFDRQLNTDRKSTRLNSSHVSISYAVFCLKKKK